MQLHSSSRFDHGSAWYSWVLLTVMLLRTNPLAAQRGVAEPAQLPCSAVTTAVTRSRVTQESIQDAMQCRGDRATVSAELWRSDVRDPATLTTLYYSTGRYINAEVIAQLGWVAERSESSIRRFTALGLLVRSVSPETVVRGEDAEGWTSDSVVTPVRYRVVDHPPRQLSPSLVALARAQLKRLAKDAAHSDVRRAARYYAEALR